MQVLSTFPANEREARQLQIDVAAGMAAQEAAEGNEIMATALGIIAERGRQLMTELPPGSPRPQLAAEAAAEGHPQEAPPPLDRSTSSGHALVRMAECHAQPTHAVGRAAADPPHHRQ